MTPLPQTVALDSADASPRATAAGLCSPPVADNLSRPPSSQPGKSTGLFLPRPVTCPADDGEGYLVAVRYRVGIFPGGMVLEIDHGFYFDGFSAPRLAWSILGLHPMHPMVQATALIHDAGYGAELFPRRVCDDTLYMTLRMDGLNMVRAWSCYRAVRFGGAGVWATHTAESVAGARRYCRLIPPPPLAEDLPFSAFD